MDGNFDGVAASVVWLPVTEIGIYIYIYIGRKPQADVRKLHKSPFFVVLNIMLCSLDVNINFVCTTPSDKVQERRQV